MKVGLYRGFSSFEFQRAKRFNISDVELVKLDLLNHLLTRRGERVMMPNFGTIIPDLLFEPMGDETEDQIRDAVTEVIEYDPRVKMLGLEVRSYRDVSVIIAVATIQYIELNVVDKMDFNLQFGET